jgi:hypothetical protein
MPYLSPIGNSQESDANGAPLSGGQIFSYVAGTTTPIATYTDSTGDTAQANPIVLNASGLPANPIWLPDGQAVKLVFKDADGVTLRTVDDVTGINDPSLSNAATEWTAFTSEVTYIGATSFSVEGDQTGTFQVNRRIRSANTGGTRYSRVSASAYDAGTGLTTVTVVNDSGSLDSGLSEVAYGFLSATNPSVPESGVAGILRSSAAGAIIDRAYAEYTANAALTTQIPNDDSIPQSGEGTQILSVSITPKNTSSRLRIRFNGQAVASNTTPFVCAIFNGGASAIDAKVFTPSGGSVAMNVSSEMEYAPGSTSAITFSVRVGPTGSSSLYFNGGTGGRLLGGVSRATLVVEEIAV